MRTALDLESSQLDADEQVFVSKVREHGWFGTRVFDPDKESPDFSYSTGFYARTGFPEIIVFSLPKDVSHNILWDIYRDFEAGNAPLPQRKITGFLGDFEAVFLPVHKDAYSEHLGWNQWFYRGNDFPCFQLVWPDREGLFPWEDGFDLSLAEDQPDLTEVGWNTLTIE